MRELLKQLFTGVDGVSHDLGRWSWGGSFLAIIASTIWNACHDSKIDIMQLATALSAVATAHGIALFAKASTEPKP